MYNAVTVWVAAYINKPLDYALGEHRQLPPVGGIVQVPLRNQMVAAIVIAHSFHENCEELKSIHLILETGYEPTTDLMQCLQWCSRYYHAPMGQVIKAALPSSLLKCKPTQTPTQQVWKLTNDPEQSLSSIKGKKQQQLYLLFRDRISLSSAQIKEAGFSKPQIKALLDKQLIAPLATEEDPPLSNLCNPSDIVLNKEQVRALTTINDSSTEKPILLEGVTGSGKTEVYLHSIQGVLSTHKQVLFMVPEIGLIEQSYKQIKQRFNCDIHCYHSSSSESEKITCWRAVKSNKPLIVIATRSAIFLPFSSLGLIVVDEEQDLSYKQQEGLRYNARDLAVIRAHKSQAKLILGSATPSMESTLNAINQKYNHCQLTQRIGARILPTWQFIAPHQDRFAHPIPPQALQAIADELRNNRQVLIFLNRRGFAPLLDCSHCGWRAICNKCDCAFTLHRSPATLICHRCDSRAQPVSHCPNCQSNQIRTRGLGTEQVDAIVSQIFPNIDCIRIDRDSTQRKGSFSEKMSQLEANKPAILVGTQMIAKGHHLPNISLILALNADQALYSFDFRALEHMAQMLTQVAGRAGRGDSSGKIITVTSEPNHPFLQQLSQNNYSQLSQSILQQRRQANLPPVSFSAQLFADALSIERLLEFMDFCKKTLKQVQRNSNNTLTLVGPIPSSIERKNNRFRYQLLIYTNQRSQLHQAISQLTHVLSTIKLQGVRHYLDLDPY